MAADVTVRFLSDASRLQGDMRGLDDQSKKLGTSFKRLGGMIVGALGGAALLKIGKDAIDNFNDLEGASSKVNIVFGESAGVIQRFTRNSAESLGLARVDALSAAGAFGNMFTQLGFSTGAAADMSKGMLTLTSDLAAFHNVDPTLVIAAQEAAFRGEYDSLQQFIPTINAAAVEQRALADRTAGTVGPLTDAEKAQATYKLMVEGAGAATGNYSATINEAATQQRIMDAKTKDASASLGSALAPAMAIIVPIVGKMATAFAGLPHPLQLATLGLLGVAVAIAAVGWPIVAVVAGIAALVAAVWLVWTNWDQIWTWIKDHPAYAVIIAILAAPIAWFILIIGALKFLWENWSEIWGWIKQAALDAKAWIEQAWLDIETAFNNAVTFITDCWNAIETAATDAKNWIVNAFQAVIDWIVGIPGRLLNAATDFLNAGVTLGSKILEGIRDGLSNSLGFAGDVATRLGNAVIDAFNSVRNVLNDLIPDISVLGVSIIPDNPIPRIPRLGSGGIATRAMLAMIGENGPEAVVPLDRLGLGTINFYVTVPVTTTGLGADAPEIQRAVVAAMRGYVDRNGPLADLIARA